MTPRTRIRKRTSTLKEEERSPLELQNDSDERWEATPQEQEQVRQGVAQVQEDLTLVRKGYTAILRDVSQNEGTARSVLQGYQKFGTEAGDAAAMIPTKQGAHRKLLDEFAANMRLIAKEAQKGLVGDWLDPVTTPESIAVPDKACADMLPKFTFLKPLVKAPEVIQLQEQVSKNWGPIRAAYKGLTLRISTQVQPADDLAKLAEGLRIPYIKTIVQYRQELFDGFNTHRKGIVDALEKIAKSEEIPAASRMFEESVDMTNRYLQAIQQYMQDYNKEVQKALREGNADKEYLVHRLYLQTSKKQRKVVGESRTIMLSADQARVLRYSAPTLVVLDNLEVEDLRKLLALTAS